MTFAGLVAQIRFLSMENDDALVKEQPLCNCVALAF